MFDDFFIRALIAGIGIALVTGPLGCFIIWRRLSFFGDTLSHSALLGVTIAFFFELNIAFSVFLISSAIALILLKLQKKELKNNYKIKIDYLEFRDEKNLKLNNFKNNC